MSPAEALVFFCNGAVSWSWTTQEIMDAGADGGKPPALQSQRLVWLPINRHDHEIGAG
jgi:hypothetical protein